MLTDCLYQASATARGGREGQAATSDGSLHAWLDLPAELGGRGHGNNLNNCLPVMPHAFSAR
jgi:organic hydroperoxide reductase OsmC/OhrA